MSRAMKTAGIWVVGVACFATIAVAQVATGKLTVELTANGQAAAGTVEIGFPGYAIGGVSVGAVLSANSMRSAHRLPASVPRRRPPGAIGSPAG